VAQVEAPDTKAAAGKRRELLHSLGFGDLMHDSHVPFLSHLGATRRLLVTWGSRPALSDAGLFHSVYGTEYFEPDRVAGRAEVTALIGPEAERLAWLWCSIRRDTIDVDRCCVQLRDGTTEPLTPEEVSDLATLWAADTVEQIRRMTDDERSFSRGLLAVLHAASRPAQLAVREVADLVPS
jgi:hypothetical protein